MGMGYVIVVIFPVLQHTMSYSCEIKSKHNICLLLRVETLCPQFLDLGMATITAMHNQFAGKITTKSALLRTYEDNVSLENFNPLSAQFSLKHYQCAYMKC